MENGLSEMLLLYPVLQKELFEHSAYLYMRWSTQNIQNAVSNIFRVQVRADVQKLLGRHFSLHEPRTQALQTFKFWTVQYVSKHLPYQ
jgi:glycerol-3-phosphate O-acyltransferase